MVDKAADSGESVVATRQSAKTNEAGFGYQQIDPLSPFVLSSSVENKVAKETKVQIQEFGADLKESNQQLDKKIDASFNKLDKRIDDNQKFLIRLIFTVIGTMLAILFVLAGILARLFFFG